MIRKKPISAAALVLLLALSVHAQTSAIKVDGNVIKGYITKLSAPEWRGRKTLTPGYQSAADWAADMFKEWGLKPAGDNGTFFQSVPIEGQRADFAWTSGVPALTIAGRQFYLADNDFMVDATSTPGAKVKGEVVFVGYGISAPNKGLDEYPMDVKGKIVVAFKGSPKDAPAAFNMFGPTEDDGENAPAEEWKEESKDMTKVMTAYEKGAAAILLCDPDAGSASFRFGSPRGSVQASPFTRPFVYVSNIDGRVFKWIMSRDPQESSRGYSARIDGIRRDIRNLKVRSVATGLKAEIKGYDSIDFYGPKFKKNTGRNVLAKIEGTDPALKSEYVVVGGHLDHLGQTNEIIYNGADDNASGSAVTMEVARLLAANHVAPKRTIVFGLWCGEEMGLLGSNYYTSHPADGLTLDKVATYFNMDMVGLGTDIGAPGALNFPKIFDVIMKDQAPEIAQAVKPSQAGPGGSDYSGFITQGIEALALMTRGGGGHPDYHDAGDDAEKIQPEILAETGQFVIQGVLNVANETGVDLLIPDRKHIYDAQRLEIPDITGGKGGWEFVKASSGAELLNLANDRAREMLRQQRERATGRMDMRTMMRRMRRRSAAPITTGVRSSALFDGNIPLLETTATLLNYGRVDVVGDDGVWFAGGLTGAGRAALEAMEESNVTLNLVNPSAELVGSVADAATKPFLVTLAGSGSIDDESVRRVKEKKALVAVECDPAGVSACVDRLQTIRKQFGGAGSLLLSMKAVEKGGDEAKQSLYLSLVKDGWSKDEIYAMAGISPNGRPGGNLAPFMPQRTGR